VNLTLLYIDSEAVIPAKAGIQFRKTGFRIKSGMTNKEKELVIHCIGISEKGVKLLPFPFIFKLPQL
jgi:hypothetical protein